MLYQNPYCLIKLQSLLFDAFFSNKATIISFIIVLLLLLLVSAAAVVVVVVVIVVVVAVAVAVAVAVVVVGGIQTPSLEQNIHHQTIEVSSTLTKKKLAVET